MIKKLSERVIKQIAAGEVIQKPYNAVKELIENAIDSGADHIQIFFKDYGMDSIIIIDNGSGFTKDDLKIATELHTTSKTTEADLMFGINSFGFRGEALASIDSISDLTIESNGNKLSNGEIYSSILEKGTKVTVKNLFKNIPARLKFIKNPQIEFKFIKDLIKKIMVKNHKISWLINLNGKVLWKLPEDSIENRVKKLFKEEPLVETAENESAKIKAFILKNDSNTSIIYVNNRPVKDKAIQKYISSLFKEYTFIHENPGYILDITIDPLLVDYNVHPAKEEVKFMNYSNIFLLLNTIFSMNQLANKLNSSSILFNDTTNVSESINQYNNKKEQTFKPSSILKSIKHHNQETFVMENNDDLESLTNPSTDLFNDFSNAQKEIEEIKWNSTLHPKTEEPISVPLFTLIGQLKNSYILFENEDGFGIFDQHAAHERKIYEQLKAQLNENSSQRLLSPIPLRLSTERKIFIEDNLEKLKNKGIYIEEEKIVALPILFKNIYDLTTLLENLTTSCDIDTEIDRLLANIACKNALKANTPLSIQQMHTLLQSALINPPICNHGRPVFKYFSNNEIKNFFKRT